MNLSPASLEAACLKVFSSDLVWRAADEMVQVAGGRGYVKPWPYERYLRDARIHRIFEGANEILRLFIALNGVQGPAERLREVSKAIRAPLRNLGLVSGYMSSRVSSLLGGTPDVGVQLHPSLAAHAKYLEKHVAELHTETERAISKYRKELPERQLVVERLANMAIDLYATAAAIARTQRLIDQDGIDAAQHAIALTDLFSVTAGRRFRENRLSLSGREDEVDATRRAIATSIRAAGAYVIDDPVLTPAHPPTAHTTPAPSPQ